MCFEKAGDLIKSSMNFERGFMLEKKFCNTVAEVNYFTDIFKV